MMAFRTSEGLVEPGGSSVVVSAAEGTSEESVGRASCSVEEIAGSSVVVVAIVV